MRGGDAKPRRAAQLMTTAGGHPWSAQAEPARVPREAQYPKSERKRSFRSGRPASVYLGM